MGVPIPPFRIRLVAAGAVAASQVRRDALRLQLQAVD